MLMDSLTRLNQLWNQLKRPRKVPGMSGTIGRPSDLIPEYAKTVNDKSVLRGYWKNVKSKI